jgi:hypothetical protein
VDYLHRVRVYREPEGSGALQDEDGLPLPGAPEPELVLEGVADVQDSVRRRGGPQEGPKDVQRDADCYLRQEELVRQARVGMLVEVEWQDPAERMSTGRVVAVRELDGRLLLDWLSRSVDEGS